MKLNQYYQKLPKSYLFATISQKVKDYVAQHPQADIIRLGIGDVTQPLVPSVIQALHEAVDEMANSTTFKGYGPEAGYPFLIEAIQKYDFLEKGLEIAQDEIFISDGAKSDSANIQELFGQDIKVAVGDPVYPVYVDSNVLSGRLGEFDEQEQQWQNLTYLSVTAENKFIPELPQKEVDVIYLCLPNNPTGTTLTKDQLQVWVDYARQYNSLIIFDAAYEAYIQDPTLPHSIYECQGARDVAIEIRSFSKRAGFTGLRLGYTVVPKNLVFNEQSLNDMWRRRQATKFNGAAYIVQRAGYATYFEPAKSEIASQIAYYMRNAQVLKSCLDELQVPAYGGENAPYIWMKIPEGMTSWEFFDDLLTKVEIVGTPGSGFGPSGEGYFRLTAFNTYEETLRAVERLRHYFSNVDV